MRITKLFFDSKAVMSAADRATRKVFSKFGAYVRTAARSAIRKRKKPSAPGKPPSSHTGLLKKFIYFSYEPAKRNVVIGPMRLNQKRGTAPEALEYGGVSVVARGSRRRRKTRRVKIAARPFMGPAFEQEKPKLPQMWADSIK